MTSRTKHSLFSIVTLLLIILAPVGVSQGIQIKNTETSVAVNIITGTTEVPATLMFIGISLILVAGRLRKKLEKDVHSNTATTGQDPIKDYVRPALSR